MDSCDFLPFKFDGILESESSDSLNILASHDLETFHHSWQSFVFNSAVFAFSIFSDHHDINLRVLATNSWDAFAAENIGI